MRVFLLFYSEQALTYNLNQQFSLTASYVYQLGPLFITWITSKNTWFNQIYGQVTWVSSLDFTKSK
jgi:hypothetical protein